MRNLADLPDDLLVVLLAPLTVAELRLLPVVCRSWSLDPVRAHLWYGLAAIQGVEMPRTGSRFSLRSKSDLRQTFFAACRAQRVARLRLFDKRSVALLEVLAHRDGTAVLRREMAREPALPVDHQLDPAAREGHATLLHAAARYGRVACATHLLDLADRQVNPWRGDLLRSSSPILEIQDRGGATPLLIAAWCGHLKMVKLLLARGAEVDVAGIPPMTSACGGKGPYDAETWARRKGFQEVADEIQTVRLTRVLIACSGACAEYASTPASSERDEAIGATIRRFSGTLVELATVAPAVAVSFTNALEGFAEAQSISLSEPDQNPTATAIAMDYDL